MITKGIIKSIDYNGNTCTVRVPFFETANNDEIISTAPISNTPGSYNGYKVEDVVWVAFEDGSMDNPVVIGKLYLGVEAEKADPRGTLNVVDSKVSNSAEIPFDTKLGSNVADNVANTNVPFSSLEQVANSLSTARVDIDQNDRDYGNRFKQVIANADGLKSTLEQTASEIRAEVKSTKETLEGTISETKAELLVEDGKISTRVEEVNKDLNGKIETTNSEIKQTADNINARITTKLDLKNEGWDYDENGDPIKTDAEGKELVQRSLGWDLTNDAWVIKAYDQNTGDTLPKEGLDIFKIKRDSLEINTPQVRLSDYPRKTIIRYAYGTKDTYPKLYANKNTEGNDIKSINDEFINGYDTNTKTNSIWSMTELPWSEDKYVWQWTQTASYKYVIKNSNDENSGYWDDQIEDTVIRQSGDSAVSYWTNCQTLVHTGENHGSNIVVTAMRKAGTKNEEEDKLTKVIHANTGEEIVEYGGAFLWWRYKTISNEWKLAAAKYKINFTFPAEVPNDDIEIIATHDDTFNPNAEGVNISTDTRIYDKETIVYSPLNTPVISLSNDSAQINYLSDGTTKAPEAADYVESEANLYLSGNKLTSNNISYNWEVIPTNGCTFEGNTNTALIKVKDIIVESVVVKCTISINNNGIDGKFKNTSYQKDFTITKAIQGDKGDTGESTYIIDIDNDFATIPSNIINKQIYRINKFKPSNNSYSRQIVQATRALPSSRTLPGMALSIMNETPILKTALTALPEETKTVNGTSTSYIENLSIHKVKVYYGTVEEEIDDKNLIIKLDHDDITEIPEGKFLVCEIGSFNKSGEITEDDYPGMNPTVENNTVTNYITTLGNNTVKSTNTYIKYSYYVNGINVASAKVELVRSEGPTTYYMTADTSTIKTDAAGTIELLQIKVNSYKLATSDGAIEPFNGWWKYSYDSATSESWRTVSEKGGMKDGTENPLIIKGTEIQSAIKKGKTKLTIELYSDSAYTQLWDKEVINVIRDGNGIASQTTYYALVHSDYIADTIKAPTEDDKIVYSGTTNLINSKKALSNWSTTAPKHKLEKTDDPNTLGWKYWTSIRTEKADGTVEYSTPIISEDLNGVYALMQGKTRNYYSNIDPTISYNVQDGDCWFDTGESYRQATEKDDGANANGTFNSIDQYRGYYFKYGGNNYSAVSQSAIDNSMVTAGTTVAYKKETNLLKQYNNGVWEDIGSELVANKVTANFINAMDITAKKISILSNGNTGNKIFEADGTSGNNSVTIGGFSVDSNSLSKTVTMSNETGKVHLSTEKISLGTNDECVLDAGGNINGNAISLNTATIGDWTLNGNRITSPYIEALTEEEHDIVSGKLRISNESNASFNVGISTGQNDAGGIIYDSRLEASTDGISLVTQSGGMGFRISNSAASSKSEIKLTITMNKNSGKINVSSDNALIYTTTITVYLSKVNVWNTWTFGSTTIRLDKGEANKSWSKSGISTDWDYIDVVPNSKDKRTTCTKILKQTAINNGANYSYGNIVPASNTLSLGTSEAPWDTIYVKKIVALDGTIGNLAKADGSYSWKYTDGIENYTESKDASGNTSTSGNTISGGCFEAGTKISMADGTVKNIEDVQIGDKIYSYNIDTKTIEIDTVKHTYSLIHPTDCVILTFKDGSTLWTTRTHPFYTTCGWVSLLPYYDYTPEKYEELSEQLIEMMAIGQKFYKLTKSGKIKLVKLVRIQYRQGLSKEHKVYNLDVENNSNFFTNGVLGHNAKSLYFDKMN